MKTLEVEARVTGTFLDTCSWDACCGHLAWQGTHSGTGEYIIGRQRRLCFLVFPTFKQ